MSRITINGRTHQSCSDPRKPFLEVLREEFGLRGTKYGCGEGECGACTILVDGETVCSCLSVTGSLDGAEVTTVEGLPNDPVGVRLFNAFARKGAVQCGFCTPGFVLSAWQMLADGQQPDERAIRHGLGGNLCRCTGYVKIIEAIRECAAEPANSPIRIRRKTSTAAVKVPGVYWRPEKLDDLLAGLADFSPQSTIIAGGTDLMVQHEHHTAELALIDISSVPEFLGISETENFIRIGATATWTEIARSPLTAHWAPLLVLAAREVGGIQIQNRGTIGGNIGNASPAGDGLPALYAYDAEVLTVAPSGGRGLPIQKLICGPRQTALDPHEIIAEVRIPKIKTAGRSVCFFEKVGPRRAQTITKGSVAFHAWLQGGRLLQPRIALGAVGPTIIRAYDAEQILAEDFSQPALKRAAQMVSEAARPIDDIRSTARYRKRLVGGLLLRGFHKQAPELIGLR